MATSDRPDADVTVIAFGSCRKQNRTMDAMWKSVVDMKPDVFLWTGDYVYGKAGVSPPERMKEYYKVAAKSEQLLRSSVPVIDGVYDDHDFGVNDGGKGFEHKESARQMFLDHVVGAPPDSPRRTNKGGMYAVRVFGTPPRQVKVIMLDTRYARDDHYIPSIGGSTWLPKAGNLAGLVRLASAILHVGADHEGDMLGSEEQWQWLESELTDSKAAAHVIVSSVQVLTSIPVLESWGHFPRSRRRLLELLAKTRPSSALLLSGDVHFGEMLGGFKPPSVAHPGTGLLEVTSSGLTHACGDGKVDGYLCALLVRLFSGHRVGGVLASGAMPKVKGLWPGHIYPNQNFGSLTFRWEGVGGIAPDGMKVPHIEARVHAVNGSTALQGGVRLFTTPEEEGMRWQAALHPAFPTIYAGVEIDRLRMLIALMAPAFLIFSFWRCFCVPCRLRPGKPPANGAAAARKKE